MAAISRMPVSIISRSVQFLLGSRRSLSFKRHEIHSLLVSNHYRRGLQLYSTRSNATRISSNANKRTVLYMTAIAVGVAGLSYAAVPLLGRSPPISKCTCLSVCLSVCRTSSGFAPSMFYILPSIDCIVRRRVMVGRSVKWRAEKKLKK